MESRFDQATKSMCKKLYLEIIKKTPIEVKNSSQEIRVRVNKPIIIYYGNRKYITLNIIPTKKDIYDSFNNICNYSVYSYQNEIKNGFITINGGHRIGICGTAVVIGDEITTIKDISSLNIRIAREVKNSSKEIFNLLKNNFSGLLIAGAPGSGKTTILRDLARRLSTEMDKKVVIIDERGELASIYNGIPENDVGLCDVLNGYPKSEGIEYAIRTLSPDVIICDEIGDKKDINSIKFGLNSGVDIIASIHANSKRDLLNKTYIQKLFKLGAFKKIFILPNIKLEGIRKD